MVAEAETPPTENTTRIAMYERIIMFVSWVAAGNCIIEYRDQEDGKQVGPMVLNPVQHDIVENALAQAATCPRCRREIHGRDPVCHACSAKAGTTVYRGIPIRLIIPKARKMGVSTVIQAWFVFNTEYFPDYSALTVAHTAEETNKVFRIALRINLRGKISDRLKTRDIRTPHGSIYSCRTGGGRYAGSGGTLTGLHISELAKFPRNVSKEAKSKAAADAESVTSLINAVAMQPHTCVFIESTGLGPSGEFYRRCIRAKNGKGEYRLCFFPWYMDPGYSLPPPEDFVLSPAEVELKREFPALTDDQLYWRRQKMQTEAAADEGSIEATTFRREFPNTIDDCFMALEGRVYPKFARDERFCRKLDLQQFMVGRDPEMDHVGLMRAMDEGWSGDHPFVILWIAYDQTQPPQLVVNPEDEGCQQLINEFLLYAWNPKTDDPIKEHDHGPDALRYAVVTKHLRGLVYVYRAIYVWGVEENALDEIARRVHEASGWDVPEDEDPRFLKNYRAPDGGETYTMTVVDRSIGRGIISQLCKWGLSAIPHVDPEKTSTSKGVVKDGIGIVQSLMSGTAWFQPRPRDIQAEHVSAAEKKIHGRIGIPGRVVSLTDAEREAYEKFMDDRSQVVEPTMIPRIH